MRLLAGFFLAALSSHLHAQGVNDLTIMERESAQACVNQQRQMLGCNSSGLERYSPSCGGSYSDQFMLNAGCLEGVRQSRNRRLVETRLHGARLVPTPTGTYNVICGTEADVTRYFDWSLHAPREHPVPPSCRPITAEARVSIEDCTRAGNYCRVKASWPWGHSGWVSFDLIESR